MKVHPKSLKHNQYYEFLPETYKKIMIRNNARILQRRSRRTTWKNPIIGKFKFFSKTFTQNMTAYLSRNTYPSAYFGPILE